MSTKEASYSPNVGNEIVAPHTFCRSTVDHPNSSLQFYQHHLKMALPRSTFLRGLNSFNRHSRLYSNPPTSTYYIQIFPHNTTDQFVLLLPQSSTPMGRIHLSVHPPTPSPSGHGPAANFISPISPENLKRDWGTFIENGGFRDILEKVVAENISGEQVVINDARSLPTGEGWVHLCDERALPAYGFFGLADVGLVGFRSRRILLEVCLLKRGRFRRRRIRLRRHIG